MIILDKKMEMIAYYSSKPETLLKQNKAAMIFKLPGRVVMEMTTKLPLKNFLKCT